MICRFALWHTPLLALCANTFGGCGPPPEPRVEQDIQKIERERQPDKLVQRGKAFAQRGDLTRAEQYLSAALDEGADPDQVVPLLMRVCVKAGRLRVAIDRAQSQLKRKPNNVPLRFLVGSLFVAIGDAPSARQHFERVLAIEPTHAQAHYSLAIIARDTEGDLMRADHHFREYLRLAPDGPHSEEARASLLESVP